MAWIHQEVWRISLRDYTAQDNTKAFKITWHPWTKQDTTASSTTEHNPAASAASSQALDPIALLSQEPHDAATATTRAQASSLQVEELTSYHCSRTKQTQRHPTPAHRRLTQKPICNVWIANEGGSEGVKRSYLLSREPPFLMVRYMWNQIEHQKIAGKCWLRAMGGRFL